MSNKILGPALVVWIIILILLGLAWRVAVLLYEKGHFSGVIDAFDAFLVRLGFEVEQVQHPQAVPRQFLSFYSAENHF